METIWYGILSVLIGTYIILDGYDLGAGVVFLFFTDTKDEKQKVLKSIRSIWDANEVWLIAFVGLASVVFPLYSKILFDNFGGYILLFFLFLLLKTISFNLMVVYKNKVLTYKILSYIFGFINTMLVVFISLIFANMLRGIFISRPEEHVRFISKMFSPFSDKVGLFDWFTILASTTIFIGILIHGLGWVVLKNSGAFNRKLKKNIQGLAFIELILLTLFLIAWYILHPEIIHSYWSYPFLFIFPVLAFISLSGLIGIRTYPGENKAFILSTNLIIFSWISAMIAIYPNFIMSLDKENLTAFNAGFDNPERFYIKWWILAIGVVLLGYSIIIHKYIKGEES
jgi:cytochrome d ubiquinol oxidase subunit II